MWRAHGSSEQDRSSGEWSPGHGGSGQQDAIEASMEMAFPKRQSMAWWEGATMAMVLRNQLCSPLISLS